MIENMNEEEKRIYELERAYERKSKELTDECILRGLSIEDDRFWEAMGELVEIRKERKELEARMGCVQEKEEVE